LAVPGSYEVKNGISKKILMRLLLVIKRYQYLAALESNPLDAGQHFKFAKQCFKKQKYSLAYAEALSARNLGLDAASVMAFVKQVTTKLPELSLMPHNEYFRYCSLANELIILSRKSPSSVLDVGGGHGHLAQFLPGYDYCLAEPSINGISGLKLPFADNSFDFVTSCHVLEHIPQGERETFLTQLLSKSRRALVLLNPFEIPETRVAERLQLAVDVTGAEWAKEHMQCQLPEIEMLRQYASERNLDFYYKPNGTMATSLALVFMEHFAQLAGKSSQLSKIYQFFNSLPLESHDSEVQPNAYLAVIKANKLKA
jgi:SAM-dependent methyltransferase